MYYMFPLLKDSLTNLNKQSKTYSKNIFSTQRKVLWNDIYLKNCLLNLKVAWWEAVCVSHLFPTLKTEYNLPHPQSAKSKHTLLKSQEIYRANTNKQIWKLICQSKSAYLYFLRNGNKHKIKFSWVVYYIPKKSSFFQNKLFLIKPVKPRNMSPYCKHFHLTFFHNLNFEPWA